MDFIISKEQKRMKTAAREFLKAECPRDFVRAMEKDEQGFTDRLWKKMGDLDWMALVIPEAYNGAGGDVIDLVLMIEEMGRACAPGPFFSTVVTGAFSLIHYGSKEQKDELLPKIASAKIKLTLALAEPGMTLWDPFGVSVSAIADEGSFVIDGIKLFVPDAHVADYIICAARTEGRPEDPHGISMFLVDSKNPGLKVTPLRTIGGDKQFEIAFEKARVPRTAVIGRLNEGKAQLETCLHYAAVCKCAEMVGASEKVLEMAVEYAKVRKQFNRPIGSFQAIQHHCANMLIDLEGSRYITYKAAWALQNGLGCEKLVAIAKAWVSEAFLRIVKLGHQVQGGPAFMEEHDMPLYSRRAASAAVVFGDAAYYRKIVAEQIGL